MKQKIITFAVEFVIYGGLFALLMYYGTDYTDVKAAVISGTFFGFFMGLSEVFVFPRIKKYLKKERVKWI